MRYVSSRGLAPAVDFEQAVLGGMAPDGGLYLPAELPRRSPEAWLALRGRPFAEVCAALLAPFAAPIFDEDALRRLCDAAFATFDHPEVAPLRALPGFADASADVALLELFHGPTLAFKDVALQLLGLLFDALLQRRGQAATILGATSGDTGSAAIAGCRGRPALRIAILHPHGRTSEVQRRQMTTVSDDNVINLAVRGSFDDCQALVKAAFADPSLRTRHNLLAVNSINVARVLAQMTYYATAALSLGAPSRPVRFCVPTGNFGDALAGHWARRLGLPIELLLLATNRNDVLARGLATGALSPQPVQPSLSPSMDITVSSNFERLLYELHGDDAAFVRDALGHPAGYALRPDALQRLRAGFDADSADDDATLARIAAVHRDNGLLVDPHTAVGLEVAARHLRGPGASSRAPMVVLATAHAAKFPDAVRAATGLVAPLPPRLAGLMSAAERYAVIEPTLAAVAARL